MNENTNLVNEIAEIEELEGKIAPSASADIT